MDIATENKKLSNLQLEFLKSLKFVATEKQIKEIKSLLHFYFAQQLDAAIEKVENEKMYTSEIYERWLESSVRQPRNSSHSL
jgi:hypothetical protein